MKKDVTSYSQKNDKSLFLLIKKRDKIAFTHIYNKYNQYLYYLAYRFLKSEVMAEDAIQHVFVKFWTTAPDINIEINLKNYLYTMTKHYILNQIRDNQKIVSMNYENAQVEFRDDSYDILKMLEETQLKSLLYEGIDSLPIQKKEVCKKKIEGNKSNQEIADEMGLSVHTVKSHYQEAIKMLRVHFKKIRMIIL